MFFRKISPILVFGLIVALLASGIDGSDFSLLSWVDYVTDSFNDSSTQLTVLITAWTKTLPSFFDFSNMDVWEAVLQYINGIGYFFTCAIDTLIWLLNAFLSLFNCLFLYPFGSIELSIPYLDLSVLPPGGFGGGGGHGT